MKIKRKIILLLSISTFLISVVIFFIILPTAKDIDETSAKIYNLKDELEKKYTMAKNLKGITKKIKDIQQENQDLMDIFVKKGEELILIQKLEGIAAANNLKQKININYTNENKKNQNEEQLDLKLQGNYIDILKYLYDLRRLTCHINIKEVIVDKEKDNNATTLSQSEVNAAITANFYTANTYDKKN